MRDVTSVVASSLEGQSWNSFSIILKKKEMEADVGTKFQIHCIHAQQPRSRLRQILITTDDMHTRHGEKN
jgi:hypothetical protein